jgi:HPt (histidine-containing phosphotransfer) domain-containing protein
MILYNKSGDFVGAGKDELSFLGFEDIDEFRHLHKDIADLFVNKPGYIFKFKNFSWIDYTLHSGAPKKNVIIKLKNGNEVEAPLKIKEIYLYSPKDGEEIMYAVDILNSNTRQAPNKLHEENTSANLNETFTNDNFLENTEDEEHKQKELPEVADYEEEINIPLSDNEGSFADTQPALKLKIDENILEEEQTNKSELFVEDYKEDIKEESKIFTEDYQEEKEEIGLKTQESELFVKDYEEEKDENKLHVKSPTYNTNEELKSIKEDIKIIDEMSSSKDEEDIDFDILKCAEELDLDISLIAELIEEYFEKIDRLLPNIEEAIQNEDSNKLKEEVYILKGISDNLHMYKISSTLINILEQENKELKLNSYEKFKTLINVFKKELV